MDERKDHLWKVAQEAFFETYHVPATHPQLEKPAAELIYGSDRPGDFPFSHRHVAYDAFEPAALAAKFAAVPFAAGLLIFGFFMLATEMHERYVLPALAPLEQTAWEVELLGLSPGGQIMRHYRAQLRAQSLVPLAVTPVVAAWKRVPSRRRGR